LKHGQAIDLEWYGRFWGFVMAGRQGIRVFLPNELISIPVAPATSKFQLLLIVTSLLY
jgi:hypothetical protein